MRSAAFGRRSGGPLSLGGFGPIHREKGKPPAPPRHFAILRIRLPRRMHRLETAFFDEAHKRICRRNAPHSGGSVLVPPPLPVRRERGECWFSYGDTRLPRRKHRLKTVAFSAKPTSESVSATRRTAAARCWFRLPCRFAGRGENAGFLMVAPGFCGDSTRKKAARRIVPISETGQFPKYMPNAAIQAAARQRLRFYSRPLAEPLPQSLRRWPWGTCNSRPFRRPDRPPIHPGTTIKANSEALYRLPFLLL